MRPKELAAVLSVVTAFVAIGALGRAVHDTRQADCHRTRSLVVGIYTILDRSTERAEQYVREGIISAQQAKNAVSENRRVRDFITLPRC